MFKLPLRKCSWLRGFFFRQFAWQKINFYKKLLSQSKGTDSVIFPSCCSFLAKVPDIWGKAAFSLLGAWKAHGQERRITGSAIYRTATNCVLRLCFSEAPLLPIIPINILELNGSNYVFSPCGNFNSLWKITAAVSFLNTKQQSTGKWRWHSPVVHTN